jgi:hypothetical protein
MNANSLLQPYRCQGSNLGVALGPASMSVIGCYANNPLRMTGRGNFMEH